MSGPVLSAPNTGGPGVSHTLLSQTLGPRGDICWDCGEGSPVFLGRTRPADRRCDSFLSTQERLLYARAPGWGTAVNKGPVPATWHWGERQVCDHIW